MLKPRYRLLESATGHRATWWRSKLAKCVPLMSIDGALLMFSGRPERFYLVGAEVSGTVLVLDKVV